MTGDDLLSEVSSATQICEGHEAVRRILREVYRRGNVSLWELSQSVHLPLPVVSAVRRELEKRGILVRKSGLCLSDKGNDILKEDMGIWSRESFNCPHCRGRGILSSSELEPLLETLIHYCRERPSVDRSVDQSHDTPQTALNRALYMYENDAVEGRDVLILGDDDLASLALGLLKRELYCKSENMKGSICVLEVDGRIVDYISNISKEEDLMIEAVQHDLRTPLPERFQKRFDVLATDPPYTLEGFELFVSRGLEGLKDDQGQQMFISFAHKGWNEMIRIHKSAISMGLLIREIIPGFNRYEGAQILAGSSQLIHALTTPSARSSVRSVYEGQLYTSQVKKKEKRKR